MDQEYTAISGDPKFVNQSIEFLYGKDIVANKEKHMAGIQTISGTGGLRIFGEFLKQQGHTCIYLPDPTWGNHHAIFTGAGLEVRKMRYYDYKNSTLDFDGLMEDIHAADEKACILLHACAHNPTGMDPSIDQWKEISCAMMGRNQLPLFDTAYQGFASGDAEFDAAAVRMFVDHGHEVAATQSYSKNFGLYGQRVGCLSLVGGDEKQVAASFSQLKILARRSYSNPPKYGAQLVSTILDDVDLTSEFRVECKAMADRIIEMRAALVAELKTVGSTKDWGHIINQIGMFAFSGLTKDEVSAMTAKHSVYCTLDGRISMAGVTTGNVQHVAMAMHDVTK
jgi:aspartate aminotransferase